MNNLFKTLLSLGIHIGGYTHLLHPSQKKILLGTRSGYTILDLQQIVMGLRSSSAYLYELGKLNAFLLFYHSDMALFPSYVKFFMIHLVNSKHGHAVSTNAWSYGQLSNFTTQSKSLMDLLFYSDEKGKDFSSKNKFLFGRKYSFWDLCHRLMFFTLYRRLNGISWVQTFDSVKKYWRFFHFFKFYSFSKDYPDTLIYCNSNNFISPLRESMSMFIPTVMVSSTSSTSLGASYTITSNVHSIVISLFYFILFLNSYSFGHLDRMRSLDITNPLKYIRKKYVSNLKRARY